MADQGELGRIERRMAVARAKARALAAKLALQKKTKAAARRKAIVAWARAGAAHEPQIHYREVRPMPIKWRMPLTTDCSGFATLCYHQAGAPDPNGARYNYDGAGWTGTLLANGQHIDKSAVLPGDLVVYGPQPDGHHVAVVVEAGPDPLTVSHGQEAGPIYIRVSQEARYQPPGITYLRFPML